MVLIALALSGGAGRQPFTGCASGRAVRRLWPWRVWSAGLTPLGLGTTEFAVATILGSVMLALGLHLAEQALTRNRTVTGVHAA